MPRPSLFARFSERRHRKRASETDIQTNHHIIPHSTPQDVHHSVTQPGSLAALTPPATATQSKHWRHRSLASIGSILHADRHHHNRMSRPQPKQPQQPPSPQQSQPHPILDTYPKPVDVIRQEEYPHMNTGTYLDHAGTTIYSSTLITRFSSLLLSSLYGNPHSFNTPAKLSGDLVDSIRLKTLRFLGADPAHYDLVFTANATAAIKLVADSFRDLADQTRSKSFWYGYHRDAHTSLVGVRELTSPSEGRCFASDGEVEDWLENSDESETGAPGKLGLFAWPAQSNLTGRRIPQHKNWAGRARRREGGPTYTLLDAAGLAMTADLTPVFENLDDAPDFVCVSFYKIFGFPDLGGLVVRRESGHIMALRKYFGGGTVEMISTLGDNGVWHLSKGLEHRSEAGKEGRKLHEALEDGTLPFHSIIALGEAVDCFREVYGSMENVSRHTTALAVRLYEGMKGLRYANGRMAVKVYEDLEGGNGSTGYGDSSRQGATVAFNVLRPDGRFVSYDRVESLANDRGIYIRSGGICNPGGLFNALQYEPWQLNRARSAGHHCGSGGLSIINGLPTGVVRASLGAMSTVKDVDTFLEFLQETSFTLESDHVRDSGYADSSVFSDRAARHDLFEEQMSQTATCCS